MLQLRWSRCMATSFSPYSCYSLPPLFWICWKSIKRHSISPLLVTTSNHTANIAHDNHTECYAAAIKVCFDKVTTKVAMQACATPTPPLMTSMKELLYHNSVNRYTINEENWLKVILTIFSIMYRFGFGHKGYQILNSCRHLLGPTSNYSVFLFRGNAALINGFICTVLHYILLLILEKQNTHAKRAFIEWLCVCDWYFRQLIFLLMNKEFTGWTEISQVMNIYRCHYQLKIQISVSSVTAGSKF